MEWIKKYVNDMPLSPNPLSEFLYFPRGGLVLVKLKHNKSSDYVSSERAFV